MSTSEQSPGAKPICLEAEQQQIHSRESESLIFPKIKFRFLGVFFQIVSVVARKNIEN